MNLLLRKMLTMSGLVIFETPKLLHIETLVGWLVEKFGTIVNNKSDAQRLNFNARRSM